MLTLTAPSDVDQHCMRHKGCDGRAGDGCRVCPCSPAGGVHLGMWNGSCSARLNRFIQELRRLLGVDVQYFRGAEVQERHALHFHLLLRMQRRRGAVLSEAMLRKLAIKHGFGHSLKVDPVSDERAAGYVAKYVSKSCADRLAMPWVHRRTGEISDGYGRYRVWTASRRWGLSMAAVRAAQAAWWHEGQAVAAPSDDGAGAGAAGPLDPSSESYTEGASGCRQEVLF